MSGARRAEGDVAEGFRWGRRPLVPRSARSRTPSEGRRRLPDRLGAHRRRDRCAAEPILEGVHASAL